MLSDVRIRKALPGEREYKLADERGLYLLVTPSGGKLWKLKYRIAGKERKLSIVHGSNIAAHHWPRKHCGDALFL